MRNLITGINGFAASHLADYLIGKNEEAAGLARNPENNKNIRRRGDLVLALIANPANEFGIPTHVHRHRY